MITKTIKQHGQFILQVRCKDYQAVAKALKLYNKFIYSRAGKQKETFLYFNCL